MEVKKIPKIPKMYSCECCNYTTSNKKDNLKHILTLKHQKLVNGSIKEALDVPMSHKYNCCGREFKTHSGLWKHSKKCNQIGCTDKTNSDIATLTNLVIDVFKNNTELQKQNQEIKELLLEQNNKLLEVCKGNSTINLFK